MDLKYGIEWVNNPRGQKTHEYLTSPNHNFKI